MRMLLVRLVAPPPQVAGYLRRFMIELDSGILVGACTRPLLDQVVALLQSHEVNGFVVLSNPQAEAGFSVPYYRRMARILVDFDGVLLVESLVNSNG